LEDVLEFRNMRDQFISTRKDTATAINTLSVGLYNVFKGAGGKNKRIKFKFEIQIIILIIIVEMEAMKLGCMQYFQMGGNCVDYPMSLLGGLESNPFALFAHYLAVACVGVYRALAPIPPTPMRIRNAVVMLATALKIFFSCKWEWVYRKA